MRNAIAALAASIVLAATPMPERIIFLRAFPGVGQRLALYAAAADGSDERPLLAGDAQDYDATWSPDGEWIVFTTERDGSADLYRVKPDGTALERLTDNPAYDDQAAFSPDGSKLVFVTSRHDGTADLEILDVKTRRSLPLTSGPGGDFRPSWSPDGQWIAFSSDRESDLPFAPGRWEHLQLADIYLVHPDGSGLKRITAHGTFCGSPKWPPDTTRVIAYCMDADRTLDTRDDVPQPTTDTRLVSIDVTSGAMSDVPAATGVKFNPSPLRDGTIGYIRKDAPDRAGIYYSDGRSGPKGWIRAAAWSPDGKRVVFHKPIPVPATGPVTAWSRVPGYELVKGVGLASFSPSGDRVVVTGPQMADSLGHGVVVVDLTDKTPKTIFQDPKRNAIGPRWSPPGDAIVFSIGTFAAFYHGLDVQFRTREDRMEGGAQIAIIHPDGTGFRELTSGAENKSFPSMAPDGKQVVYRSFGRNGGGLRVLDIDRQTERTLTNGYDNFPVWSPRGDLIAFSRQVDGNFEIFTIKPDGGGLRQLTHARGNDAHVSWSPDGEWIVFGSERMGFKDEGIYTDAPQPYGELFVMRYDGSQLQQLTDNQWEEGAPTWVPHETRPLTDR